MAIAKNIAGTVKIWLLAMVVVLVMLGVTQDSRPVHASHTEIYFTFDTSTPENPRRASNIVTSVTSEPIVLNIWAQDPHDPVWSSGIGAVHIEIQFDSAHVIPSAAEVVYGHNFENQCTNAVDDDPVVNLDGFINDGCPQVGDTPETGAQCTGAIDDDGDGVINDGCPAQGSPLEGNVGWLNQTGRSGSCAAPFIGPISQSDPTGMWKAVIICSTTGVPPPLGVSSSGLLATLRLVGGTEIGFHNAVNVSFLTTPGFVIAVVGGGPETGTQCDGNQDDDADGFINDGCPATGDPITDPLSLSESGIECVNADDDDADGVVNDGCPTFGDPEYNQCTAEIIPALYDSDGDGVINDGCPAIGSPEYDQCDGVDDEDFDGWVNDGCPTQGTNVEALCFGNADDDGDGRVNDGCPEVGGSSETGAQCTNAIDDDGDEIVNDGCPAFGNAFESGAQCSNATDDDGDGAANDGCPAVGIAEDSLFNLCTNDTNDDDDGVINDGCPAVGPPEFDQCGNAIDDDGDTFADDGCTIDPEVIPSTALAAQFRLARCGSLNGDNFVAFTDFLFLLQHFGEVAGDPEGSPDWNENIDLNDDGAIAFTDFLAMLAQFNSSCLG